MAKRPAHLNAPDYLTPSVPVPAPDAIDARPAAPPAHERDATRYGDWELKGIAIDF